jgi:hypothetical protein
MLLFWIGGFVLGAVGAVAIRAWYRKVRARRIAERRIVEKPNSFYSSVLVKNQEDRERWGGLDLTKLHPVNREEVERLLTIADVQGLDSLSPRERLFLENMTRLSYG